MTAPDETLARYRLISELGRGAHATVHLAEDPKLGRRVALKVFAGASGVDEESVDFRFTREVAALSRIDTAGVCRMFQAGTIAGTPYIAMSYVQGRSFCDLMAAPSGPPPDRSGATAVIEAAARTLHAVHRAGVVHGDLKPANLMVGDDGTTFIVDFSLARAGPARSEAQPAGGTLPYMAPEHFTASEAGFPADIYALGATLFEALAGRPPFVAPTRQRLIAAILGNDVPDLGRASGIDRDLSAIVERCLEREPARRYATALDLAEDLARRRRGEAVRARRTGPVGRTWKLARRHPASAFLVVFLVTALAAGLVLVGMSRRTEEALFIAATAQSERARERSAEAGQHLAGFLRLADVERLADLERRSAGLWPPRPGIAADIERLLEDAQRLEGGLDRHRAALAALQAGSRRKEAAVDPMRTPALSREIADFRTREVAPARAAASALEARAPVVVSFAYDDSGKTFEVQVLSRLVTGLEALANPDPHAGLITSVRLRLDEARTVRAATIDGHAAEWARVIASIADRNESPAYAGMRLRPQEGLVPLGRDPESGLFEFHLARTGDPPERAASGGWIIKPETGIVLTLIPGGEATLGAARPGPGDPEGRPFVDPDADSTEAPVHRLKLAPFFISKYEMTQGQWLRATGRNPSEAAPPRDRGGRPVTLAHPVESVTWREATATLWRLGLRLPTEAQWEYASRAGTATPWWTGSDPGSLRGAGNVLDLAHARAYPTYLARGSDFDDGYVGHAPVGRFRANAFGLHDTAGNVDEWCLDCPLDYGSVFGEGDGELLGPANDRRVRRGGSATLSMSSLRSSARGQHPFGSQLEFLGVRPARPVE